ncbi:MAG: cysteine desulfurase NifS [Anaerolineae bacterium]|nr:cysteine desulfurase NifS [Anaerolineae bacterium]
MKRIYMDHNATTPLREEVLDAMLPYLRSEFGNASSVHSWGIRARRAVEAAREQVAAALGAHPREIIFTGCGTEADNQAIKGVAFAHRKRGDHIITSRIEHKAVLETCEYLEKHGFRVTYLPVDAYGMVNPDDVAEAITDRTILVSVMFANNEVGTIQPVAEIARVCRERDVYFHTDAVQAVGKLPIDVKQLGVDLLSLSAHKFYGPKGVGALYVRRGVKIDPLLHGGHQEWGLRAATENVAGIVGLGKALELRLAEMEAEAQRLTALRERLYHGIVSRIDHVYLNGHPTQRLPGTLSLSFDYIEGEAIILGLDLEGVAVSSGSACTSASLEPSHVLLAMGVHPATAQGSIRFSLGRENTEEDVDYVLEVLPPIIQRLREMSMFSEHSPFPEEAGPRCVRTTKEHVR